MPARLPLTASSALASSTSWRARRLDCSESCLTSSAIDASDAAAARRSVVLDMGPLLLPRSAISVVQAAIRLLLGHCAALGAIDVVFAHGAGFVSDDRLARHPLLALLALQFVVVQPKLMRPGPLLV